MAGRIERPRVEHSLREAVAQTSLTLLAAPMGAGKTLAAAGAFASVPGTVWMDAQPWHRGTFIREIVQTVRAARTDFGRLTLGALDAGAGAVHLGALFADELRHVDEPLYVIVDNAHVFAQDERFLKFVDAAVSELPPLVRILALGRSLPDRALLKSFSRRRVCVLDAGLLALDEDELRRFARAHGRELDEAALRNVARVTEGWAMGVALTLATPDALAPVTAREMLSQLGREHRQFLERVWVFETIDLPVLERHPFFSDVRERIAALVRRGAYISQLSADAYRMHPLLRDLLAVSARSRGEEPQLHGIAARAYLNAGNIPAALYHADAAGNGEIAADVLRADADLAFASGDHERVRRLLDRIEPGGNGADVLLYAQGLFEKASGAERARTTFLHAAQAADVSGDHRIAFNARTQIVERDLGSLAPVEEQELDELDRHAASLGASAQVRARVLHGWAHAVRHDFAGALDAASADAPAEDPAARFNLDILRAYALTALGRCDEAQTALDALIEFLDECGSTVLQALTLVWFARLGLLWGRTAAAGDAAAQAQRFFEALALRAERAALFAALAESATHAGDVPSAVRYAQEARAAASRAWYAADVSRIDAFAGIALARAAFLGHDNAIARDLALRVAEDPQTPNVQRAAALAEASIYTLLCDPGSSAAVIERARAALREALPLDAADAVALATSDDLLAFLDEANGRRREALARGCEPFAGLIAERRGLVTLELAGVAAGNARRGESEGVAAFDVALAQIERDGPRFEAQLAKAYAATFVKPRYAAPAPAADFDLTAREREILELLVDGLSNKEIAQRLVLSPRTVETHVERILGKLDVGSRSRAIAKSIRLGLVAFETL